MSNDNNRNKEIDNIIQQHQNRGLGKLSETEDAGIEEINRIAGSIDAAEAMVRMGYEESCEQLAEMKSRIDDACGISKIDRSRIEEYCKRHIFPTLEADLEQEIQDNLALAQVQQGITDERFSDSAVRMSRKGRDFIAV